MLNSRKNCWLITGISWIVIPKKPSLADEPRLIGWDCWAAFIVTIHGVPAHPKVWSAAMPCASRNWEDSVRSQGQFNLEHGSGSVWSNGFPNATWTEVEANVKTPRSRRDWRLENMRKDEKNPTNSGIILVAVGSWSPVSVTQLRLAWLALFLRWMAEARQCVGLRLHSGYLTVRNEQSTIYSWFPRGSLWK